MNYHNITTDDMLNGEGLRVVLWVSGCEMGCKGCQNPETHDHCSGVWFDEQAENELFEKLSAPHIDGITFSGGHPLMDCNLGKVYDLIVKIRDNFPTKTIWLYTGYTWEQLQQDFRRKHIVEMCDVVCDGRFVEELLDVNKPWVGSSNQRVIDVKQTVNNRQIVLYN